MPEIFFRSRATFAAAAMFALVACGHKATVAELSDEFVNTTLSFSPVAATAAGLHEYKGVQLDGLLDDDSPAAISRQRSFFHDFNDRLSKIDADKLDPGERADLDILQDRTGLALLDLDRIQPRIHTPTVYVETIGNALFTPYTLGYAPQIDRFRDIISRLRLIPQFLEQARANLATVPSVFVKAAIEENQGNIDLVDRDLRNAVPAQARKDYDIAADLALAALRKFQDLMTSQLQYLDNYDWRLGSELYERKFRLAMESAGSVADTMAAAQKEAAGIRAHMYEIALPLYNKLPSAKKDLTKLDDFTRQQTVISAVLETIAQRHSTPQSYLDDARRDLAEARTFLQQTGLVELPPSSNLQVTPTPEFERGVYAVGGFNPAPPLEPRLGAYYWITPIPSDWPKDRVESKLREYNTFQLKLLTLHEAIPGHWVQMQTATALMPQSRRLLRTLYGSDAYIEGWAEFAASQAIDAGFLNHAPEIALLFGKEQLRVAINTILDIRLHTMQLSDEDAMRAMQVDGFQEKEEAAAKLRRAKLTSCQLPTYFVGWSGWLKASQEYRTQWGGTAAEFNNRALQQGAVPLSQLVNVVRH
jgi:uncharacterized protein (DUF885 family)